MRISLVITNAWPLVGGLEKLALRVAQHLRAAGVDAWIVCRFTSGRRELVGYFRDDGGGKPFECEGVPTIPVRLGRMIKWLSNPLYKMLWRPALFVGARDLYCGSMTNRLAEACYGADIVHYFGNGPELLGFAAARAAMRLGSRFVITPALHAGQWGDSWMDAALYKRADLILAHSNFEKTVLEQLGIARTRCCVVRHGADMSNGGLGSRFRQRHGITGPMILFLGRKTREKGVVLLLASFHSVRRICPQCTLVLAGPSEGKCVYETYEGIIDLDDLAPGEKEDALDACDVLCVPSEGESFGMVYFEAWSYRKPVIALDLPTLRETIGVCRGGLLVANSVSDVAGALRQVVVDNVSEAQRMGLRGYLFSLGYQWPQAIKSFMAAYEQVLSEW